MENGMKSQNKTDEKVPASVTGREWVCRSRCGQCLCRGNPNQGYHDMRLGSAFEWLGGHYSTALCFRTRREAEQACGQWNKIVSAGKVSAECKKLSFVHPVRVRFSMDGV
jgi:hypothetical protein